VYIFKSKKNKFRKGKVLKLILKYKKIIKKRQELLSKRQLQ